MKNSTQAGSVLILGAKGMLGGQFLKLYGPRAIAWDRAECDITDSASLQEKLARLRPGAVVNCVAYNDVDGAEDKVDAAYALNVSAVAGLAAACKQLDIPLMHFSTNYVFDGQNGEYDEQAEPAPLAIYGKTKHQGEIELAKNTDMYYLVRTAVLFGPKGESELSKKSFVELMLELAEKKQEVRAVSDETNSLTFAPDLARQAKSLLDDKKPFGVYHVINSGQASWFEFAREIFRLRGLATKVLPVSSSEFARKAVRPAKAVLLNTKLPGLRSWQSALKEFLS